MLKPKADSTPEPSPEQGEMTLRSLFDHEESNLLRYAYVLTGRRAVAEEIVQDVFLELHSRWADVRDPKAWLQRCVRNRAFRYLKRFRNEVLQDRDTTETMTDCSQDLPDTQMQRDEIHAALRGLLESLSSEDQRLVQWKYFEGLKYREISERSGLSIGNVGFRLHRILKQLASDLKPLGIEDMP